MKKLQVGELFIDSILDATDTSISNEGIIVGVKGNRSSEAYALLAVRLKDWEGLTRIEVDTYLASKIGKVVPVLPPEEILQILLDQAGLVFDPVENEYILEGEYIGRWFSNQMINMRYTLYRWNTECKHWSFDIMRETRKAYEARLILEYSGNDLG